MLIKEVLVSTLLCGLIQVTLIPGVISGVISTILVEVSLKQYTPWNTDPDENVNAALHVNLTAPVAEVLVAKWDPLESSEQSIVGYEVTLLPAAGGPEVVEYVERTYIHFSGLNPSTTYKVSVQPKDESGQIIGSPVMAEQATLDGTYDGRCLFPSIELNYEEPRLWCAVVDSPASGPTAAANDACLAFHPGATSSQLYRPNAIYIPHEDFLENLRLLGYTEELLVMAFYQNGWMWGMKSDLAWSTAVDPSLLVGVPEGGDGPNDYTMLYLDPAKDFGLSAANAGHEFGGMVCITYNKTY